MALYGIKSSSDIIDVKTIQSACDAIDKAAEDFDAAARKIEDAKGELESLQATKAAAIEAARKEQNIQKNKEEYCLTLPREEERDIPLLREVQYKISKPRAIAMCI